MTETFKYPGPSKILMYIMEEIKHIQYNSFLESTLSTAKKSAWYILYDVSRTKQAVKIVKHFLCFMGFLFFFGLIVETEMLGIIICQYNNVVLPVL